MIVKTPLIRQAFAIALALGAAVATLQQSTSAATLVHRYTFNLGDIGYEIMGADTLWVTNVNDVVGGSAWDCTLPNGGIFTNEVDGSVTNGRVQLYGAAAQQYAQFPVGILSNYTAITVDMWGSLPGAALGGSDGNGFLFTFGNTDANGNGGQCIFLQPADARLTIASGLPSWGTEQSAYFPPFVGATNFHLTCVIDPPTQRMLVYTNGALASAIYNLTTPMSAVNDLSNYVGRSLFNADGLRNVDINEFRIWDGALSGLEVAGFDVAGPDSTTPATINVTNLTASAQLSTIATGGRTTLAVTGAASNFPNPVSIDNPFCTFTSANTGILTVDTNGVVTAVSPGTSSITVQYGSASVSVPITVIQPPTVLEHRYSFTGDLHDSVGGTNWDGVASNGVDLVTMPGYAILNSGSSQYIQFPSGIITNDWALTVDMWCYFPTFFDGNCFLWAFGDTDSGGAGSYYVFAQPSQGRVDISGHDPGWAGPEQGVGGAGNFTALYTNAASELHLTMVLNPLGAKMTVYTNGVPVGENTGITWQMDTIHDVNNYIARSLYDADAYISVNVDEYRIYDGVLTPAQVAQSQTLGPNAVPDITPPPTLSASYSGGNIVLSWSTNSTGFQVMSKTSLTDPTWNPVGSGSISGANYQLQIPATNTSQFFRLSK